MNSDKYIHSEVEDNIYSYWEKNELFKPKKNSLTKRFRKSVNTPYIIFRIILFNFLWRQRPESNRDTRICNPLRNHSATLPVLVDSYKEFYIKYLQLVY